MSPGREKSDDKVLKTMATMKIGTSNTPTLWKTAPLHINYRRGGASPSVSISSDFTSFQQIDFFAQLERYHLLRGSPNGYFSSPGNSRICSRLLDALKSTVEWNKWMQFGIRSIWLKSGRKGGREGGGGRERLMLFLSLWIFEVFGSLDLWIFWSSRLKRVGLRIVYQHWSVVLIGREQRMKLLRRRISALVRSARKRQRCHVLLLYFSFLFFEAHSRNRHVWKCWYVACLLCPLCVLKPDFKMMPFP